MNTLSIAWIIFVALSVQLVSVFGFAIADLTFPSHANASSHVEAKSLIDNLDDPALPTHTLKLTPDSTSDGLAIRAAKPVDEVKQTGACMLGLLEGVGSHSQYTEFPQIQNSGWRPLAEAPGEKTNLRNLMSAVLAERGWNLDDFQRFGFEYPQTWIPDRIIPGSYFTAKYICWVNPKAGVIVRTDCYSPQQPYNQPGNPVPLHQLSDFLFLCYQQACGQSSACLRGLKWVFSLRISNPTSVSMMNWVRSSLNTQIGDWPGQGFAANNDEGLALIGCPNGYGAAWMLLNHVSILGSNTIQGVRIFGSNLAFSIVDDVGSSSTRVYAVPPPS